MRTLTEPDALAATPEPDIGEPLRAVIRRRVGGRWAVSWQGYLLFFFMSVPLSLLVVPAFFERDMWLTGLLVASGAYGVTGIVLFLASVTVLRHRRQRPAPVLLVACVGGLAWFARSAVFAVYLHVMGIPSDTAVPLRLAVGFLLGVLFVPAAAWLFATLDDFRQERRRLVRELVRQETATQQSADYLEILRNDLWQRVINTIRVPQLQEQGNSATNLADDVEQLAATVRTTSHDVSTSIQAGIREDTRIRFLDVLTLTARRPYALWPMPYLLFIALVYISRFTPIDDSVLAVATGGFYAAALAVIANGFAIRNPSHPLLTYIASVIAQSTTPLAVAGVLILTGWKTPDAMQIGFAVGIPLLVLMILGGVARGVNVAKAEVLADLRECITQAEITQEAQAAEETRILNDIATHLHGTITANLTAATMRLRLSMIDGDVTAAQQAYAEARRQLDIDLRSAVLLEQHDLPSLLTDIANAWAGIATITINAPHLPNLQTRTVRDIVDVVTEAVANAIRHGNAQHITVTITEQPDALHLTVTDDGSGVAEATEGLGSALFDRVGNAGWSIGPAIAGGSRLTVQMALEPAPAASK